MTTDAIYTVLSAQLAISFVTFNKFNGTVRFA
jgi:hypothetical protein